MNEEMLIETTEETNTEIGNTNVDSENSGGGILGKIVFGLVAAGAAAGVALWKNRDKLEARRIKKLEKKGYIITKPSDKDESKVIEADFTEVETEE